MKRAVVVGSGAGGATMAKELQGAFDVTVLEAGREFKRFPYNLGWLGLLRRTGVFFDEREIRTLFPAMKIRKTPDGIVLVNGIGCGGTTTIATGNGIRCDRDLAALGIDLDEEFDRVYREIPVSTHHRTRWHPVTTRLFEICCELNLDPRPSPKMGNYDRCIRCGRCVFGCPAGAKWDARRFLAEAIENGASLVENCRVEQVVIRKGAALGVAARTGGRNTFFPADLVVLSAGGLGTPVILEKSGISCEGNLFVDPVICVAGESRQASYAEEISMPFIVQRDRFILSPYIDYLSFFFNRLWRYPLDNIVSVMVKLADTPSGRISGRTVTAGLHRSDQQTMEEAVDLCSEILCRYGIPRDQLFLGTINAGHPGGMMPLTRNEAVSLHHDALPENLYIADATLLPAALGNPPILTIIALAMRIGAVCRDVFR
jgi:choline dehydrogenase-like flavoprotein